MLKTVLRETPRRCLRFIVARCSVLKSFLYYHGTLHDTQTDNYRIADATLIPMLALMLLPNLTLTPMPTPVMRLLQGRDPAHKTPESLHSFEAPDPRRKVFRSRTRRFMIRPWIPEDSWKESRNKEFNQWLVPRVPNTCRIIHAYIYTHMLSIYLSISLSLYIYLYIHIYIYIYTTNI